MDYFWRLIEYLLGIEPAAAGEGTQWHVSFAPPWAPWVLLLFVIGAVALILWLYAREGTTASRRYKLGLAGLRIALVLLVLFMLSGAVLSVDRTGLPFVVVMVDDSGSMSIADHYADPSLRESAAAAAKEAGYSEPTRLNVAKAILTRDAGRALKRMARQHKLRVYYVSSAARLAGEFIREEQVGQFLADLTPLEPAGEQTRLGAGLRSVLNDLRGTPPSAIVLLSDGINTDGESLADAAAYAARKQVPLYTVAIGDPEPVRDLELHDLLVDEVVFVNDQVTFEAKLTGWGVEGQQVDVVLHEADGDLPLATRTITAGSDGQATRLRLTFRPTRVGDFDYVLEARPVPREFQLANNRVGRRISVRDEKVKVLLVESAPRWEFRYLKNLLERDTTVELHTVLQQADPEYAQEDATALPVFPVRREDVFNYDVLIFGDVDPTFLSASVLQNVADFVQEKGGGLLMIAGPRHAPLDYRDTPLETILPIEISTASAPPLDLTITESFQPELTPEGRASPIFRFAAEEAESLRIWRALPGLFWLFEAPNVKPAAVVLATHPSRTGSDGKLPVFVMQFVGAGKCMFHATDDTWRWRYRVGDAFFARFWVQAIRFLSRSKLLGKDRGAELTADRREYRRGEPVNLRVRFTDESLVPLADDGVTVVLERQGHESRRVALERVPTARSIFEGIFTQAAEGSYHAWMASPI
ncbi:MAG: hypothetical protein ACOC46_04670, partial [Pirellulales bacterium]